MECPPEYESLQAFANFLTDDERAEYTRQEFRELCFWLFKDNNTTEIDEKIIESLLDDDGEYHVVMTHHGMNGKTWLTQRYVRQHTTIIKPVNSIQSSSVKTWLNEHNFVMIEDIKKVKPKEFKPPSNPTKPSYSNPFKRHDKPVYPKFGESGSALVNKGLGGKTYNFYPTRLAAHKLLGSAKAKWD